MKRYTYYIMSLLMLLTSCGDAEFEFSRYPCNVVFDNTAMRSPVLATSTNPMSPGVFCRITLRGKYFRFENNQGQGEDVVFTAIDAQRTIQAGIYNESGVIVGYGNLNSPATFYAYDSQCPNCYKDTGLPRYMLSMDTSGKASCNSCNREYDLNNGGIVSKGDGGDKLIRYRGNTTGPQGVLTVIN